MTNSEIRAWYRREVRKISVADAGRAKRGDTIPQRAYRAWEERRTLRLRAREMMEDPLEVELLRARDSAKYGDPHGPSFEDLFEALRRKGLPSEDCFIAILAGAQRTNTEFDSMIASGEAL